MKIKTSKLEGMALCYTLCMIEMPHLVWGETIGMHHASRQIVVPELAEPKCYSPFMNWEMLGPLLEREKISVEIKPHGYWMASYQYNYADEKRFLTLGDTPLVAAMRCFVQATLGDEIEIPDDLG